MKKNIRGVVSLSEDNQNVDQDVGEFMHTLIEGVADEMHYYIYETMGAEYDPVIRDNQNKIKELETRIKNMKSVIGNIEYDEDFKKFMSYHSKFFMAAAMISYATGLPIGYDIYLFEEDGKIAMEDNDDY